MFDHQGQGAGRPRKVGLAAPCIQLLPCNLGRPRVVEQVPGHVITRIQRLQPRLVAVAVRTQAQPVGGQWQLDRSRGRVQPTLDVDQVDVLP